MISRPKGCFLDAEAGSKHVLKVPFDKCGVKEAVGAPEEGWVGQILVVVVIVPVVVMVLQGVSRHWTPATFG